MKLRKLSVNQLKRFTVPTQLGELSDGLNLVVGPNEVGKSTLLDALRAVLFERHGSRAQPIVALQNDRSGAAPVVELVFEIGGAEYTLTKRFVRSPFARLQCPDGALLESDAAENELRNLLGFAEAGNRGATSESLGMWGVLWVLQGQSFGRPGPPRFSTGKSQRRARGRGRDRPRRPPWQRAASGHTTAARGTGDSGPASTAQPIQGGA